MRATWFHLYLAVTIILTLISNFSHTRTDIQVEDDRSMSEVTHRTYVSNRTHLLSLPGSGPVMSLCNAGGIVQPIAVTIVMLTTILSLGCMDVTTPRDLVLGGPGAATSSAPKDVWRG